MAPVLKRVTMERALSTASSGSGARPAASKSSKSRRRTTRPGLCRRALYASNAEASSRRTALCSKKMVWGSMRWSSPSSGRHLVRPSVGSWEGAGDSFSASAAS